jgi:hypothetical protein
VRAVGSIACMRIAALVPIWSPNAVYRVMQPMLELARRGHAVGMWQVSNLEDPRTLLDFEVLYGWRAYEQSFMRLARMAKDAGLALVWDNDDDLRSIDAPSADQKRVYGGYSGNRVFRDMLAIMRMSQLVTTPSATLADRYRAASGADVRVIENHVESIVEPERSHRWTRTAERVVVGWVANREHGADADRLRLREPLQRLLGEHPRVEIVTVGVNLTLDGDRYRHVPGVAFGELREHVARFDVGIAPIADTAFNQARSNIKVKEYAALGIPWLASPIGPYAALGEREGGALVADGGWYEALDGLVRDARRRRRLARAGIAWAKAETIGANFHRWEAVMQEAVAKAPSRAAGRS